MKQCFICSYLLSLEKDKLIGNEVVEETEKIGDSFGDGTLLMENQSAQNRREFKCEYFVLAAAFQREPFYLSNLPSGGAFFGLQTSAGHVLCAKAIGLSGYDCMQTGNEAALNF